MRFCNNCGFQMSAPAAAAPQMAQAPAPQHAGGYAANAQAYANASPVQASYAQGGSGHAAAAHGAHGAAVQGAAGQGGHSPSASGGPTCWRCRAAGDAGADFCKFCGARYADDPARGQHQAPFAASSVGSAVSAFAYGNQQPAPQPKKESAPTMIDPPRAEAPRAVEGAARALLVAILKDGSDGRIYALTEEQTDIGRTEGHILLSDDPYLSPRHVRVLHKAPDQLVVRDLDTINGVYVRVREPVELVDGDFVLLGQQVMRFETLPEAELPLGPATHRGVLVFGTPEVPRIARLVQYTTEGVGRDVHYLYRDETVVGREQGDIVCTDDPFMSRRHAAISIDRSTRRFTVRDLGSSNGTAIRCRGEHTLRPGDQFRVGRHLFRYDRPGSDSGAGGGRVSS